MKIEMIPKGKKNRKTRQQIMAQSKVYNETQFKKELAELRENYIIAFENDGYYVPDTKEEIQEFIKKYNKQNYNTVKIINLAYGMLEEMDK